MKYRLLIPALLASAALLSACGKNNPSSGGSAAAPDAAGKPAVSTGPVAEVNGEEISASLFDFFARNSFGKHANELKPEQKQQLLDKLIDLEVGAQTAVKNGLDKDPDIAARLELQRLSTLADSEVAKHLGDARPTEQEMRAEYETRVASMPAQEYRARHIVVATEVYAQSLIDKIKGGTSFEEVARKQSMDSSNKEKGGDTDWFSPNDPRIPTEFSKAVEGLKKGEMTQTPVKTDMGYHVIRLDDTRPTTTPEYDDRVKTQLGPMVQQKKVQAYLDELKKTMKIEKKI